MIVDPSERIGRWLRRPGTVTAVVVSLLLLAVVLQPLKGPETQTQTQTTPEARQLYLPSAAALDRMALSFDSVVADVYWIRALQHFGTTRRSDHTEKRYDLLYPLLDIATTLDPRFSIAYRFGAIFLAEPFPDGPGRPDQAVTLLQKGARQMPERWEYLMDTGFVYTGRCTTTQRPPPGSDEPVRSLGRRGGCSRWRRTRWLWAGTAATRVCCGNRSTRRPMTSGSGVRPCGASCSWMLSTISTAS